MNYLPNPESIVLHRSDFLRLHDYAMNKAPLRDFCLIRVPMKSGLRPGEIRNLRWENVDLDKLTLNTVDSKKHVVCPIPMDAVTADFLKRLHEEKTSLFGWVIERDPMGKAWANRSGPLGYDALDKVIRKWAKAAGIDAWKHMNLYDLRHFFAASWAYPADGKRPGNLHALSKIMRHKSMLYTQIYLSRLVFYEDLQTEFTRLQSWPFAQGEPKLESEQEVPTCGNQFFDEHCRLCGHHNTCRFMDEAMSCSWANGCKYFTREKIVMEEMQHNRI
jgi:integrase